MAFNIKAIHPVRKKVRVSCNPFPHSAMLTHWGWERDDPMYVSQHCRMGEGGWGKTRTFFRTRLADRTFFRTGLADRRRTHRYHYHKP